MSGYAGRARKVDLSQREIVDTLRDSGYLVRSLSDVGKGMADLIVALPFTGHLWLVENKTGNGKLTPDQVKFQAEGWPVVVLRNAADVVEFDRGVRRSLKPGKLNRPWP